VRLANPADELYRHRPESLGGASGWAERSYHLLAVEDVVVSAGRAVWSSGRERTALACVATPVALHAVRTAAGASPDGADDPLTESIAIEVLEPLRRLRIRADNRRSPAAFDLTFEARTPAVIATPNRISQHGRVVTDYTNFFQSGRYSGWIAIGDRQIDVDGRAGFRDRGWGLRKHEGAPRRGLVLFCACELPAAALHLGLYETASGERARFFGWLAGEDGAVTPIASAEHDLRFEDGLLEGGRLELETEAGDTHLLEFEAGARTYLRAAGYSADPAERRPGAETHPLTDAAARRRLSGQVDSACRFLLDGAVEGHGFVEIGLGEHARYDPPAA
jgi:hypothetical protein